MSEDEKPKLADELAAVARDHAAKNRAMVEKVLDDLRREVRYAASRGDHHRWNWVNPPLPVSRPRLSDAECWAVIDALVADGFLVEVAGGGSLGSASKFDPGTARWEMPPHFSKVLPEYLAVRVSW